MTRTQHLWNKWQDILITDLVRLPSCIARWFYQFKVKKSIQHFLIQDASGKKASLYQHGPWNAKGKINTVLLLHGLYSHPCVMLHLAELAQQTIAGPTFTLYLPYDDARSHRTLIKQAIDAIEKMALEQSCCLTGLILVGHSMGAIEAAHAAFVDQDPRIFSVISIGGRLKVVDSLYSPCRESLKSTVNEIYENIRSHASIPLYQIAGRHDWNAPLGATLVRTEEGCYHIVNAMHFNILFHRETGEKLVEFLKNSKCAT